MRGLLGVIAAAGLAAAGAIGVVPPSPAEARPIAAGAGSDLVAAAAASLDSAQIVKVGYHRGHHRGWGRGYGHRVHVRHGFHRPVYYRPAYYRPVHYRPAYHRPVRYRPVYYGGYPAYGGYGYGPRCVVRYRPVRTWDGYIVRRPVRVCRW